PRPGAEAAPVRRSRTLGRFQRRCRAVTQLDEDCRTADQQGGEEEKEDASRTRRLVFPNVSIPNQSEMGRCLYVTRRACSNPCLASVLASISRQTRVKFSASRGGNPRAMRIFAVSRQKLARI